jgi:hypothetical protein
MKQVDNSDHDTAMIADCNIMTLHAGNLPIEVDGDDSDSDENIFLPLPIPSNML